MTLGVEQKQSKPLVVVASSDSSVKQRLRAALHQLGFSKVVGTETHSHALEYAVENFASHVFFDGRQTDISPLEFVEKMSSTDNDCGLIGVSNSLHLDVVFELLRAGARGFLVPPFSSAAVEQTMRYADEEKEFKRKLLQRDDRDIVLTEVLINNFNMLARLRSAARIMDSDPRYQQMVAERKHAFLRMLKIAKLATGGDDDTLLELIMQKCIKDAGKVESRLGRVRLRLSARRTQFARKDSGGTAS
jgi:FixJ family two-component response regulator